MQGLYCRRDWPSLGGISASNGNFTGEVYRIDKTALQAGKLVTADITADGDTIHSFTVVFSDNLAIDIASLDSGDIRATEPGGFDQLAAITLVPNKSTFAAASRSRCG